MTLVPPMDYTRHWKKIIFLQHQTKKWNAATHPTSPLLIWRLNADGVDQRMVPNRGAWLLMLAAVSRISYTLFPLSRSLPGTKDKAFLPVVAQHAWRDGLEVPVLQPCVPADSRP